MALQAMGPMDEALGVFDCLGPFQPASSSNFTSDVMSVNPSTWILQYDFSHPLHSSRMVAWPGVTSVVLTSA